jgi:hypothetical protein
MKASHKSRIVLTALTIAVLLTAARSAQAVSCNGGATARIVINNPTASTLTAGVTMSGTAISGLISCTDQQSSYSKTITAMAPLNPGDNPFTISGLNTGMWVHTVTVSIGGNQYNQYQKGVVLKAPDSLANPYSKVKWTYFPQSINVKTAGDGLGGGCGANCQLRQALSSAAFANTSAANPLLIFFTVSPGTMTNTAPLSVTSNGYITIDGTNSSGNPWIVGEALSSQDSFPTIVDLANVTYFSVSTTNDTIKGLSILNTTATGAPQARLIQGTSGATNLKIDSVRLDGGAGGLGSCGGCASALVTSTAAGLAIANVEGRSAAGYGVDFPGYSPTPPAVSDSWFHHNLNHNLNVNNASITRNVVELGGFRASDNTVVNNSADGIFGNGGSDITTSRNVVRDNPYFGLEVTAVGGQSPPLSLSHDYICGNGNSATGGAIVYGAPSGVASGTGLTAAYNSGNGIYFDSSILSGSTITFNNNSAFTANTLAGLRNASTQISVSATGNQWRGVTGNPPLPSCTTSGDVSGIVVCDPAQDHLNVAVDVDSGAPAFPSNVMRSGQTIRVQGSGFTAIGGNPLAGTAGCSTGPGATSSNCCRTTAKANSCDGNTPPDGQPGKGNCTAIRDRAGTWNIASPVAVTPTTITTALPSSIACIGQFSEKVRVSKLKGNGAPSADQEDYCTNANPK